MTNVECRMTNQIRNPNVEGNGRRRFVRISGFGLLSDFVIRISSLSSGMNDECRMSNDESNPKSECRRQRATALCSDFGLRASFGFRHSDFVIVQRYE